MTAMESVLYDDLADPRCTRRNVAQSYAAVMRYTPDADWGAINAAILERYRPSGLEFIKQEAWKINERIAAHPRRLAFLPDLPSSR